jgi:hypothetical protein
MSLIHSFGLLGSGIASLSWLFLFGGFIMLIAWAIKYLPANRLHYWARMILLVGVLLWVIGVAASSILLSGNLMMN